MSGSVGSLPMTFQHSNRGSKDTSDWRAGGPSFMQSSEDENSPWRGHIHHSDNFMSDEINNNEKNYFHSPPPNDLHSTSSAKNILARPGHVFWHTSPSPSQQIMQRQFRKDISSNTSPLQPLGTQAFRDELLKQGTRDAETRDVELGKSNRKKANPSLYEICEGRDSIGSSSMSSTNGTATFRKFSRRVSRRSMNTSGESSFTSNATSIDGGVHRLLADLNEHLNSYARDDLDSDLFTAEETSKVCDGSSGALDQNESLTKELDRIFSSPEQGGVDEVCLDSEKTEHAEIQAGCFIDSSPSQARSWSRIKSSPAEMEASPRIAPPRKSIYMTKINSSRNPFEPSDKRQRISSEKTDSQNPCNTSRQSITNMRVNANATRTSPRKRTALIELKGDQEAIMHLNSNKPREAKTRSSASPPKKWASSRAPRIGLSRTITGSTQSHGPSFSGANPAAPFKRPSKIKTSLVVPTVKQQQSIQIREETLAISNHIENEPERKKDETAREEDISFDTSMDEDLLCDALDKVEATQEMIRMSQLSNKKKEEDTKNIKMNQDSAVDLGDESFEFNSSDNEAMVSAMEAGGW